MLFKRLENIEMTACYYGNEPETLGKHDFLARLKLSKLAQEKVKKKTKHSKNKHKKTKTTFNLVMTEKEMLYCISTALLLEKGH